SYLFFLAGWTVSGKGKDIGSGFYHSVNNIRDFINICTGYRSHDHTADTGSVNTADFFQRDVKRSWLPRPVMSFSHAVQRKLIFLTAVFLQFLTDLIV